MVLKRIRRRSKEVTAIFILISATSNPRRPKRRPVTPEKEIRGTNRNNCSRSGIRDPRKSGKTHERVNAERYARYRCLNLLVIILSMVDEYLIKKRSLNITEARDEAGRISPIV